MYGLLVNGENVCVSGEETPLFELDALSVKWITYVLSIEQLNGNPSTASLTPMFQGLLISGQGNDEGQFPPSGNVPWFDITDASTGDMRDLQPGGPWGTVATESFVNTSPPTPQQHVRRVRGGFPHRLVLRAGFAGGTTPSWRVSVWINQEF